MPSNLKKLEFDYQSMQVQNLYFNNKVELPNEGMAHDCLRKVFNRNLMFGAYPKDRPYIYNSLVTSIDGKIAFMDQPQGPLVARNNLYAGAGATLDYWLLNVLRASADGILVGTASIAKESKTGGTGHCYDANLEQQREIMGKSAVPWRIVVTFDGLDVNFETAQFTNPDMSAFFYTTTAGIANLTNQSVKPVKVIGPFKTIDEVKVDFVYDPQYAYAIVAGEDKKFNHQIGLKILKMMGINTLLVESPTISHVFMQEKYLDELFINQSGLFIGGQAVSLGSQMPAFESTNHPHTELISLDMHSPHFIYLRYRLIY